MALPLPSNADWPEDAQVAYTDPEAKVINNSECQKLMEHYEKTLENKTIRIEKQPKSILSLPDCKVQLMVAYAMARYEKKQYALDAGQVKAELVGTDPEVNMMDKQVTRLLYNLADTGTAALAYYRTPIWEIVWRFVETKEIAKYDDGKVPWLRDPHKPPLDPYWPGWIEKAGKIQPKSASDLAKVKKYFRVSETPPDSDSIGISNACEQPLE